MCTVTTAFGMGHEVEYMYIVFSTGINHVFGPVTDACVRDRTFMHVHISSLISLRSMDFQI